MLGELWDFLGRLGFERHAESIDGDLLNHMQRGLEVGPLVCGRKRSRDELCM